MYIENSLITDCIKYNVFISGSWWRLHRYSSCSLGGWFGILYQ